MANTLLLVDDEESILRALERVFFSEHYTIMTATNGEKALELLATNDIQIIISDQRMPYMTGSELFSQVKNLYPDTIRIILSGYADFDAVTEAINKGAIYKFINKPWDSEQLRQLVREAFQLYDLQIKDKHASQVLEKSLEGVMITDNYHIIQQVNPAFVEMTGFSEEESIGRKAFLLDHDSRNVQFEEIVDTVNKAGEWKGEILGVRKSGEEYPAYLYVSPIKNQENKNNKYLYSIRDLTKQKSEEERLMYIDQLTGLYNRLFFFQRLHSLVTNKEQKEISFAFLVINIDHFSNVNDAWGHHTGDLILQEVGKRLQKNVLNDSDLSRLGSDEFALLLHIDASLPSLDIQLQNILKELKEPFVISGEKIYITVSVGVSLYPQHSIYHDQLIKYAHMAFLGVKKKGGDGYQLYSDKMEKRGTRSSVLANDLHRALAEHEFVLFFQPIISVETNKVVGFESLLRWQHPKHGLLTPQRFIGLAENTGLIIPIGEWILQNACQHFKQYDDAGYDKIYISVNLSARQFNDPGLLNVIKNCVSAAKISPERLVLEITESVVMQDLETSVSLLNAMRKGGCRLAMDDFGTGYSSLNYLKRFPFNILKIDKSFIDDLSSSINEQEIVSAIITLGKKLGLQILAEGVEREEQLLLLKDLNCDLIQGYFFSKPLPAADALLFLKKNNPLD